MLNNTAHQTASGPTKSDQAMWLGGMGCRVFRGVPDTKRPAEKGWQDKATCDLAEIAAEWTQHPDSNIMISTEKFGREGKALLVLDIDMKNGKDGYGSLAQLEAEHGALPPTLTTKTPNDGEHRYFWTDKPVRGGANKLGPGLDVKSSGGFAVGPGSTYEGKPYTTPENSPGEIAGAPDWLVARCDPKTRKSPRPENAPRVQVDAAAVRRRAEEYLRRDAPLATAGGRNDAGYKTACVLKDMGAERLDCLALMADHWRCEPELDADELERVVDSAYRYGQSPIGSAAPEVDFEPIADTPADRPAKKSRLYYELFNAIEPDLDRPALVEGLLDHGAMSVLFGESNVGKSFVALDIAFHVADGRIWHGRAVEQGSVAYVAAEGGGSFRKRIKALRKHYGTGARQVPLALCPCSIDLSGGGTDVQPLLDMLAEIQRETGGPIRLIVIDTLARALAGGNENASDDMGAFVRNIDRLRDATGAHILIIHHSGKNKQQGARGHSSLRAATDTELEVTVQRIAITKQRDREMQRPIGFDLLPVEISCDAGGHPVKSCVVAPFSLSALDDFTGGQIRPDSVAGQALADVMELSTKGSSETGLVSIKDWRETFSSRRYPSKPKVAGVAFSRAKAALVDANRITVQGDHVRIAG